MVCHTVFVHNLGEKRLQRIMVSLIGIVPLVMAILSVMYRHYNSFYSKCMGSFERFRTYVNKTKFTIMGTNRGNKVKTLLIPNNEC